MAHFVAVLLDKGVEVRHFVFASATQEDCWSLLFIAFIGDFTHARMKTAYLGERLRPTLKRLTRGIAHEFVHDDAIMLLAP